MDYLKYGESHHEVYSCRELDASRNTDVKIRLLQCFLLEDFRTDHYDEAEDDNINDKNDDGDDDQDDNNDDRVWTRRTIMNMEIMIIITMMMKMPTIMMMMRNTIYTCK